MKVKGIASFSKVSFKQFKKDWECLKPTNQTFTDDELKAIYDDIPMPQRGTGDSYGGAAGYDIVSPVDINIAFGTTLTIPTGLKCQINDPWFLDINPRSGQGFKYGIRLANTRGIIDNDYYNSPDNEGHILIRIVNESVVNANKEVFKVQKGQAFCQGIFTIYGTVRDDQPKGKRKGGFGSTDEK